jgi:ATP-dependent Clp protease ATP-binding subunit ClpC
MFKKGFLFTLLTLSMSLVSTQTFAKCVEGLEKDYDHLSESPIGSCAGLLRAGGDRASSYFEGDLVWLSGSLPIRIGAEPVNYVVTDNGIMSFHLAGKNGQISYWDSRTKTSKLCADNIPVSMMFKKELFIDNIDGIGMSVRTKTSSKAFYEGCKNSGNQIVYLPLSESDKAILQKFSPYDHLPNDLTHPTTNATLPEILERDDIVDKIISRVRSGAKRSLLLWGPAGVGKTAVVYRLATRIARGEVPAWFKDWKVYVIDLASISADGKAGLAEKKMREIVKAASGKKVVLLMDEIHQLLSMGKSKGDTTDVTEVMKTNLANGQLAVIGTLTDQAGEMSLLRTKKAFYSRFTRLRVDEPGDKVLDIIYGYMGKKSLKTYGVKWTQATIDAMKRMTNQYASDENHPRIGETIIDILAKEKSPKNGDPTSTAIYVVTNDDIKKTIGEYTNNPLLNGSVVREGQTEEFNFEEFALNFDKYIRKAYVGQEEAIKSVKKELITKAASISAPKRPTNFLFLGPSGVGKTYLANLTAKNLGIELKVFAMSQFSSEADVNSLLGAPEGYVGYRKDGGLLVSWIKNNPGGAILFDEIDKAHPQILDALINLLEEGEIMGKGGGQVGEFKNGFIFFTSNYGMDFINSYDVQKLNIVDKTGSYGHEIKPEDLPQNEEALKSTILDSLIVDSSFGTYFAGRIKTNNIVIFHHLNKEEGKKIAMLEIKKVAKEYRHMGGMTIGPKVLDFISDHGIDFRFGARTMRNLAQIHIQDPANEEIVRRKVAKTLPFKFNLHVTMDASGKNTKIKITEITGK